MSNLPRLTIVAILALLPNPAVACAPPGGGTMQELLLFFPDAIERDKSGKELTFCPDNTCIRVRSIDANANLDGWLLAYLFHFGGYYALSEWRAGIDSPATMQDYPHALQSCLGEVDAAACHKQAFSDARITVLDVTYDEGGVWDAPALFSPHAEPPPKQ